MNVKKLIDLINLIKNPGQMSKSLFYSMKFKQQSSRHLPIEATWLTKIKTINGAKLNISEKLFLGILSTQIGEIGQRKYDHTILQLDQNSTLNINGSVRFGPGVRLIM